MMYSTYPFTILWTSDFPLTGEVPGDTLVDDGADEPIKAMAILC